MPDENKVALITGITGQDGADLAEFLLAKGYTVHGIKRLDGTPRKLLDVSKLSALGWKAKTPLQEGLRAAYADFLRTRNQAHPPIHP